MRRSPTTIDSISAEERRSSLRTLRKVVPYLWPADQKSVKYRVVLAMVVLILAKLIAVYTPVLYKGAVDALAGEGVPPLALGAVGLTVAYGVARVLTNGFQQLRDAVFAPVTQRALRGLALETFQHIHRLSMRYHITRKTGGLSRIIERGVKGVEFLLRFLLFSIGPLVLELVLVAIILTVLFDARYLLAVGVTIALYVWFTLAITEWRVKLRREMNKQDTDANQKAIDSLLNFETVKYFGAEEREAARYDGAMRAYAQAALKTAYSLAFLNFGQSVIITGGLITVMVMAAIGVQDGSLSVGDFVMVNAYMVQITVPLNFLGSVYREIRQSLVDMGEMFDLLEQPPDVKDRPNAAELKVSRGHIRLEDLHFGYDPEREILKGITMEAKPGETVAIVGSTGSGKSTIGRLLFRFYDVTGGALTIDGQDVRNVSQKSLHAAIGVVPQDTVLFNDTIRYNIAYGRDGATQQEIEDAARAAQIHDFIAGLPQGYDTQVGERGLKLSGGEKQRVGIARTLLKDPPILLLDEATSALDTDTEREIKEALARAGQGRTVITIAHRLSTVAEADQIVVLEQGEIAEAGSHEDLLARGGRYAHLWQRQQADQDVA
ncbi:MULTISPECIES: ABCB family ABC transporter ATP-binding protein/permease [Rhodobacterales]|jgi:ATP-binding cassette subfamily B protein|uniref:ABCB family ABC transporter ATP-binding protein/permease n=1 Tax=Rhodobacterales TaxID=204455 RepID=UPI00237F3846|nr:ABC transporter ATP-binding protein/permease [Phaeobacter gallaeciensis]MDE4096718.1 ABC transporter ATP-binding protein/permease [Phaeobacter gallaeciensis]MDE4105529.1 ABC transporter ATP-binding protein/permease [Phaeobacter gallaeciensis]MDE4109985.1 ABC transporter ATP-binding protein/permease [Phaeobacter gallaeciensis]MDE4114453.1 ABC transporter ATP-binding protein/permease [Phaeobacter gallaeciensis]MDE4118920.1 ABC transporter ATP-binding protein/permease [Phaeobacter gallaeciensi